MFLELESQEGAQYNGFHSQASAELGHPIMGPELDLALRTDVSNGVSDYHGLWTGFWHVFRGQYYLLPTCKNDKISQITRNSRNIYSPLQYNCNEM